MLWKTHRNHELQFSARESYIWNQPLCPHICCCHWLDGCFIVITTLACAIAQLSVLENYSIKSYVAALSVARCCNFDTLNSCIGLYLENIDLFDDALSLVSGFMLLLGALLGNIDNLKLKFALRWENIGWPFDSCWCPQTKRDLRLDSIQSKEASVWWI